MTPSHSLGTTITSPLTSPSTLTRVTSTCMADRWVESSQSLRKIDCTIVLDLAWGCKRSHLQSAQLQASWSSNSELGKGPIVHGVDMVWHLWRSPTAGSTLAHRGS